MALLVGRGKYLLQEEVVRGISGVTYKAINQSNNQVVVIKTFKSESLKQNELFEIRKKFLNEAQRLIKCSHPSIIPYHEFFIEDGIPYIVMDYILGKTLDKIVLPDNPLPEATALEYIRQVAGALKVVHDNGLLHRDVKPQNLILRQDRQQIVLIDFGISREFSKGSVETHTSFVSEGYAPIEQYLPKAERTPATDIYGLAATLYTLLTAQIPIASTLRDRLPFNTPKNIRPDLSDRISEAVMKGMALELEERPSSVDEWLALLPQTSKKSTQGLIIDSQSRETNQSVDSEAPFSKSKESDEPELTSIVKQSDKQNQLLKILIIGLFIFLGLDYAWLKLKSRSDLKDLPTQPNITNQR